MTPQKAKCAQIHLLCGKTGSGKTTYARKLEQQGAVRLSLDEWMIRLYGGSMSRELFDQRVRICEELFFDLADALVSRGVDVVLDHGFWKREARDRARQRLSGTVALVYFPVPDPELLKRLRERNAAPPAGTFVITEEMFETFSTWFEPPDASEHPLLVTSSVSL